MKLKISPSENEVTLKPKPGNLVSYEVVGSTKPLPKSQEFYIMQGVIYDADWQPIGMVEVER